MTQKHEADILCSGIVRGTPRTYGDAKRDDVWRRTIIQGDWTGVEALTAHRIPVHLDFDFRIFPGSKSYWGRKWEYGPDLDTMVIGALGGLLHCRNPARPTLRLIEEGGLCRVVTAQKRVVDSDEKSGFILHIRAGDALDFDTPPDIGLSVQVRRADLKGDRRRAVQKAAASQNPTGFRAPRGKLLEIGLAFAVGATRNPLSADWLEAVIDGLGASPVGTERFFDGPSHREFGYDDSGVLKLSVAHVTGLPTDIGLHIFCRDLGSAATIDTY